MNGVIALEMPSIFEGGFILNASSAVGGSGDEFETEAYVLRRIEIRKPGRNPPGRGQVLPHVLEAALVHQQVNGPHWANVVVGFDVLPAADPELDVLTPLVAGQPELPSTHGDRRPLLMRDELDLNVIFYNATFLSFWSELPTTCGASTPDVNARFLMRSAVLPIASNTFNSLLLALQSVPDSPPVDSPAVAWHMQACASGSTCTRHSAPDSQAELTQAETLQSQAVMELRERRQLLDVALNELENGTASTGAYRTAVSARDDLRSAEAELSSVRRRVDLLTEQTAVVSSAAWDSHRPQTNATSTPDEDSATANSTAFLSAIGRLSVDTDNCNALQRSPVDIKTDKAMDPSLISQGLSEPIQFKPASLATVGGGVAAGEASPPTWHVANLGSSLRVSVPAGASKSALGAIVVNGIARDVAYMDVHAPSEHTVDGQPSALELQLFHDPHDDMPFVAVALRFRITTEDNPWLAPLVAALPLVHQQAETVGKPLAELHSAISEGPTAKYYRYDGTLTSPPCHAAQWYVLEDMGHISVQQLAHVKAALATQRAEPKKRFEANFVVIGMQRLISQIGVGSDGMVQPGSHKQELRLPGKRRVNI